MIVNWSDIVAECGNYKQGFVATFLKYEGQPTDEKDNLGRTIKVTERSFAEHNGIPQQTFNAWVRADRDPSWVTTEAKEARSAASHANVAKNMAKKDPARLAEAIELAGSQAANAVYDELKLRRAGVDTSEANRKSAHAHAHKAAEPIRRAFSTAGLALCVQALKEANEYLQQAISDGAVTEDSIVGVSEAFDALSFTMAEARFATPSARP